jgi:hypothetical protein
LPRRASAFSFCGRHLIKEIKKRLSQITNLRKPFEYIDKPLFKIKPGFEPPILPKFLKVFRGWGKAQNVFSIKRVDRKVNSFYREISPWEAWGIR